jgi:hypothetical protein
MTASKILVSLFTIAALTGYTSAASAQVSDSVDANRHRGDCDETKNECIQDLTFKGKIPAKCTCDYDKAAVLSATSDFTSSIGGSLNIKTKCNSKSSKLILKVLPAVSGTDDPGGQTLAREFSVSAATGSITNSPYSTTTRTYGPSLAGTSTATINGKISTTGASAGQDLYAGDYKMTVNASLTP